MKIFIVIILCAWLVSGCTKSKLSASSGCVTNLKLTPDDSIPFAGETIKIYTNQPLEALTWSGPDNFNSGLTNEDPITIPSIKINQSGWYYCSIFETGCDNVLDSVYIRVRYQQGVPSCSLNNNSITNTAGAPDISNATVTRTFRNGSVELDAYGGVGYPEYYFYFNSYNGDTEPKDGIYYTTNVDVFDDMQDADVISVASNYFPYYFNSDNGEKIYVSHVNGKLRISFCSLRMDDSSGINGMFSGQLTEP